MNNYFKLALPFIFPFYSNANEIQELDSSEPYSISMGVYQTDVTFDWSIDNSHTEGHPEKASEIIWNTKALGLEFNYDTKWVNRKIYFAMADSNKGVMTDEDWRYDDGVLEKWSSTRSKAEFFQVGYRSTSVDTRWRDKWFFDTIDFNYNLGIGYEQFKAMGLTNAFNGEEMRPSSVKVISNKMITVHTGIGFDFEKKINNWAFGFEQSLGFDTRLSLDYHHLRADLENVSFVIFSPYITAESKLNASYFFSHDFTLSVGASYSYSHALMNSVLVRQRDAEEGSTDLNNSAREEIKAFITLSKKFG